MVLHGPAAVRRLQLRLPRGLCQLDPDRVHRGVGPGQPDLEHEERQDHRLGPGAQPGLLADVPYPTSSPIIPAGTNRLAVYTPPGYDPHRSTPYPTVYLFSGGDNETDWTTQGNVSNILDDLIDTGQIQPMVVVMPNSLGETADSSGYPAFDANLALESSLPSPSRTRRTSVRHRSRRSRRRESSSAAAGRNRASRPAACTERVTPTTPASCPPRPGRAWA
ncbi:alpha/beta hydrolase [Streptomyces sp. CA-249302]|uniref:alpha/beta hydrolase n=1 Tax=Streptomyces sp. CA-249302 TaxID=3240058 RepID=UPI003D91677D